MKAPDKIYLHGYSFDDEPCKAWEREPKVKGMRGYPAQHAEYIRKDALIEKLEKAAASYKRRSDEGELVWQNMCGINEAIETLNAM